MKLTNNMNKYFTRLVINLCMNLSSTKVHTIFRKSSQVGGQIKRKVECKSKTCIELWLFGQGLKCEILLTVLDDEPLFCTDLSKSLGR